MNETKLIENYSNYLISLFFKTHKKYKCYRTKINRLLVIFKLCNINNLIEVDLNYELLINKNNNQFGFPFVFNKLDRDIYNPYLCVKETCERINDEFDTSVEVPKDFKFNFSDEYSKSLIILEEIFRYFGNFSREKLNTLLLEIIQNIPIKDNEVDIINFKSFINSNILADNQVLNFIKSNYVEKKNIKKDENNIKKYNLSFFNNW